MPGQETRETRETPKAGALLMVTALGVVFGDIGTSPLYAVQTIFERTAIRPVPIDQASIYGVISVIVWSITLVVTVLYVQFIMRADNAGEGGLLSLVALLRQRKLSGRLLKVLATIGIFGAALFFGDSMITPAISVLSSTEGLQVIDPGLGGLVVPGAVVILVTLLVVQRWGTARVGRFFGPVMAVWFAVIAIFGTIAIAREPAILQALSPTWAVRYLVSDPLVGFLSLGGVVLVLTGAEALYADMGHLGRKPIARAWLVLVFPAVTLNYLGQGALLLRSPGSVDSPFFLLVPRWALIPMVILATMATVIASQAVISGAFSVARQATQLGYLPRLRVIHTSAEASESGQIYLPFVNWLLLIAVLALVVGFRSSAKLAAAYGLADIGTIMTSTALFFVLQWARRAWPAWRVWILGSALSFVVLMFLLANSVKIAQGGWLPVSIGVALFVVMTTWQRGRELSDASREKVEGDLQTFVDELHDDGLGVHRVPGCAVFLSRGEGRAPLAMRANVEHNHALHECAVLLTVEEAPVPSVAGDERIVVNDLGYADDGISHLTARLGYRDPANLPSLLHEALDKGLEATAEDIDRASYFLSVSRLRVTRAPGMVRWRKHLYLVETRLIADPIEFFDLPRKATVSLGAEIDI